MSEKIVELFGLPDARDEYRELVERDPESLTDEELYNRTLTLWDTDYRELKVPTSAGDAHVIVTGPANGKPVVLLHGMNASSTMWYPNINALSQNYRVYAVDDILGAGKSRLESEPETVEEFINWYFELFEILELRNPALIGTSQGGWHATKLALTQPHAFDKILLLSPVQTATWLQPNLDVAINALFAVIPSRAALRTNMETMSNNVDGISQLYIDQFYRAVKDGPAPKFLSDMQPFDDEELSTLNMPVLYLAGERDHFNNQKSIDRVQEILPAVKAEIVPDSGHFLTVDQAEWVNQKMLQFIGN